MLTLSGTNGYTGGTTVENSTLIVQSSGAIADGASLAVGDPALLSLLPAAVVPSRAESGEVAPVPEPSTLALFSVAVCGAAVYQRLGSRRKKQ